MPKVSVIVPIYNVEKYLNKCIDSLVNQTLQDIEIILVNDGATDNSGSIANEYAKKYPEKIKYYSKENGGLSDARNYGLKFATGDYIAFLDADDYIEKEAYEEMYEKAINENSDYVECDFIWEYLNKTKIDKRIDYNSKKEMFLNIRVVAWNKLIKRNIIKDNNLEFPKGLRYEDTEFTYKMIPYIKKFSYVDKPFVHYVQRSNSIANNQNERDREIFIILETVIDFYKSKNLYEEYKNEIEYTYTRILLCSSLKRMCKIKEKRTRQQLLNETWKNINEKFPNWKKNVILQNSHTRKNLYIKSVNNVTYKLYAAALKIL